jgi:tetratricopeptide (TPR) repeat protein
MGVVFKARQATLDRDVAVKFLRDAHRADPGRRERFLQEARAVARLRHPHLVQVYEFGEVPAGGGATSQPYLVLEYVSGGSLAEVLRGSPQPPAEAARLVETLADAIHYAHQQGVIHRDLKPANVLLQRAEVQGAGQAEGARGPRPSPPRPLSADLCAKVTDFGLAKFLTGSDLTHSGDVLGTPCYMAPEQAAGNSGPITAAVDVYGLGAILYEALTGCPPFAAAAVDARLGLVRQDEPVPPRRLRPAVPRDLETICLKCLRKEAGRRYATAQDLADDLRRFRAGEPVRARPVGTVERVVGWCRRKPGVAGLLAALVLVFLAGSSGVLWQWRRASRNAAEAEQNAAAFRRERDAARQEKGRAEHHLQMVRARVDRLSRLGRDLLARPGLYRTGQAVLEEALAFYQEMLPEEGNDPRVRREAAQLFRQVAEIRHSLGRVLAAAGQAREAEDSYQKAVNLLDRLAEQSPESAVLRADLARTLAGQADLLKDLGRLRDAEEVRRRVIGCYERLKADFPEGPHHRRNLVVSYLGLVSLLWELGRQAEAAEPYRKALGLGGADPAVDNELAWFLATSPEPSLRDAALAVRLAKKAVTARPRSADYRNTLGVAYYRNGDDKAAVAELETAMSLRAGGNSFDWFFLAMAHWRLGDRDKARAWLDRAVQGMDRHKPHDDELRRFRAEAEAILAEARKR